MITPRFGIAQKQTSDKYEKWSKQNMGSAAECAHCINWPQPPQFSALRWGRFLDATIKLRHYPKNSGFGRIAFGMPAHPSRNKTGVFLCVK